jgi:hypothetical protein
VGLVEMGFVGLAGFAILVGLRFQFYGRGLQVMGFVAQTLRK